MVNRKWLQTRINLLRRSKERVSQLLGPEPEEITQYASEYKAELKKNWRKADLAELLEAISSSEIVYGADFHGYAQAQRTHLRILRRLQGRPVVIALEVLAVADQPLVDSFLRGALAEAEFLQQIHWQERWGVPFEHYRPLLTLAQQNAWRVVGLDCRKLGEDEGLEARDIAAALTLRDLLRERAQQEVVYVIFGDLHVAERHLPQKVANVAESPPKKVIVFQNAESIYFELVEQGGESNTDLVALGDEKFCVMTSPPWVQWQSYLMYLENALDVAIEDDEDGEGDEDEDFDDDDVYELGIDYTDYVVQYVQILAADLDVNVEVSRLSVFTASDENVWDRLEEHLSQDELKIAAHLMEKDRSFFAPPAGLFYLSRASVNHASYLAALFLYWQCNGLSRCLWTFPDDLLRLAWRESFAFFMSKMINHKRIAVSLHDIQRQLTTVSDAETREILQLVVEQRMAEVRYLQSGEKRELTFRPRQQVAYIEAARLLGALSGERLYIGVREGRLTSGDILNWLKMSVDGEGFSQAYLNFISRLESFVLSYSKDDRV